MSLNEMFDLIERTRSAANWAAAFGEPQTAEGRTVIPVAQAGYVYGFGFGEQKEQAHVDASAPSTPGNGSSAGGAVTKPLGALVVTSERVYFEGFMDLGRVIVAGCVVGAFVVFQMAKTVRTILGSE